MSARILLVDDHEIYTNGLRTMLEAEPDLEVVGEARDGRSAVELAARTQPDVVLMDLSMSGMNGIEATRQLRAALPGVKVLCLSIHADSRFVDAALDAGASGYLPKDSATAELIQAIRTVASGRVYLSPSIAGAVVEAYRGGRSPVEGSPFSLLTGREREVLQLLAEGGSTKEIAARLHVSEKTVATHRERVMEKVGIHSVAGLTKYAIRQGLTEID